MRSLFLLCLLVLNLCFAQNNFDTTTPFEKVVVLRKKDGTTENRFVLSIKKTSDGYELEKAEGGVALFPASEIIAIIPQYPRKGIKYGLEDVRHALKTLKGLPSEYVPSQEDLKKWESIEEILSAARPESSISSSTQTNSDNRGSSAVAEASSPLSMAGITLKNVMDAEELYQACRGPMGNEFIGKSVIIEGIVDAADSFRPMDELSAPKNIKLVGARKPTGGNYQVKCEVRGPIVFLFERGNLYARYFEIEESFAERGTKIKKPVFYTVDDQKIEGDVNSKIDLNTEFPIVNKGNRLLIAQKMKIVGMTRMGDLELVGANIQKAPLSWDEIKQISETSRTKTPASSGSSGGKYQFKNLFIEIER
ncbi:MAG: hypothetical protein EBR01_14735 [Proteobacteria bacterium]|nr:hypothetical protein [Pseudomonadota bacterium]